MATQTVPMRTAGWVPDELAMAGRENLDPAHVARYDGKMDADADVWKAMALQRVRAMLRPGGVFRLWDVVYDFPLAEAAERFEAWCALGGEVVDGEWSRAEMEEHVRDEHSTFSWLLEPMLAQAGF